MKTTGTLMLLWGMWSLCSTSWNASAFVPTPAFTSSTVNGSAPATTSTSLHVFDLLNEGKKALVKKLAGDYDADAIRSRIDNLINDNAVLMLSFTTCPFCVKAKDCLNAKGARYTVVELDTDADGKAMRAELGDLVGRTSVPAIWIQQKFVGGCNDGPRGGLLELDKNGQLDGLLQQAGAV